MLECPEGTPFLIYINDLTNVFILHITIYVDDILLLASNYNIEYLT